MRVIKRKQNTSRTTTTYKSSSSSSTTKPTTNTSTNTSTNYEARISALETKLNSIKECDCDKSILTSIQSRLTTLETNEFSVNDLNDVSALIQKLTDYGYFKYDENAGGKIVKVVNAPYKTSDELIEDSATVELPYNAYSFSEIPVNIRPLEGVLQTDQYGYTHISNLPEQVKNTFRFIAPNKLTIYIPYILDNMTAQMYFTDPTIEGENTISKSIWIWNVDGMSIKEIPVEFNKTSYTETINTVHFKIEVNNKIVPYYTVTFPENIITVLPNNKFISHEANSNVVKIYTEIGEDKLGVNDINENKFVLECDSLTTHYVIKFIV